MVNESTSKRNYNQYCGLAKALDIVGERWTLLIVRNLLLGPLRYSALLRGLPGITTNLLAKRLREMEEKGLVEKVRAGNRDSGGSYRLTRDGAGLEAVVHALGHWAWQRMKGPELADERSFEWMLVALRRRYLYNAVLRAELVVDDVPYRILLTEMDAEIARGEVASPDLRIRMSGKSALRMFSQQELPPNPDSDIRIEGDHRHLRTLLHAFSRGEPDILRPVPPTSRRSHAYDSL